MLRVDITVTPGILKMTYFSPVIIYKSNNGENIYTILLSIQPSTIPLTSVHVTNEVTYFQMSEIQIFKFKL